MKPLSNEGFGDASIPYPNLYISFSTRYRIICDHCPRVNRLMMTGFTEYLQFSIEATGSGATEMKREQVLLIFALHIFLVPSASTGVTDAICRTLASFDRAFE